jgi:hypothetical protein
MEHLVPWHALHKYVVKWLPLGRAAKLQPCKAAKHKMRQIHLYRTFETAKVCKEKMCTPS